ncbi:hypothetical protein BC628DRAFT_1418705 [Trametes gibbosa]|nr:hypothetical protein BC628DRAFT_1418705 [Trametes gibbosa]
MTNSDQGEGRIDPKDVEAGKAQRVKVAPPLRPWFPVFLAIVICVAVVALSFALHYNTPEYGWDVPGLVDLAEAIGFKHLLFTMPPILVSMSFSSLLTWTDMEVRRLQPLINLAILDKTSSPERTLLLDYTTNNALFTVRNVWCVGPDVIVASLSKVGPNQAANFMDLISFQAASSFASAHTIYDIGPGPFVSGDFTIAEFKLPDRTNGTVYAERPAVYTQVACATPDSLVPVHAQNAHETGLNFTAFFGECNYTLAIESSDAQYTYGMAPAIFKDCMQDFSDIPLQYLPVLFWFFMSEPEPMASVTMCTPHALGQNVSVVVDLATKAMNVTVQQDSPEDADVANIGSFAYNGVFFNEDSLDRTALSRLKAIQQQLPGAVFEAARAKDPLLEATFVNQGFLELAHDVYTTYLTLVAKSVYFVPDEGSLTVSIGFSCRRRFLVPAAATILIMVLAILLFVGFALHVKHWNARKDAHILPCLGTLAAAMWLAYDIIKKSNKGRVCPLSLAKSNFGVDEIAKILHDNFYTVGRSNALVVSGTRGSCEEREGENEDGGEEEEDKDDEGVVKWPSQSNSSPTELYRRGNKGSGLASEVE